MSRAALCTTGRLPGVVTVAGFAVVKPDIGHPKVLEDDSHHPRTDETSKSRMSTELLLSSQTRAPVAVVDLQSKSHIQSDSSECEPR
jgi:hypothetical protein